MIPSGNRLALAAIVGCAVSMSCAVRDVTLDTEDSGSTGGTAGSAGNGGAAGQTSGGSAGTAGGAGQSTGGSAGMDGGGDVDAQTDAEIEAETGSEAGGAGGDANAPDADAQGPDADSGPTCSDNTQNGDETDKDCGGSCPARCADGKGCETGADCLHALCNKTTLKCVATQCEDGVKNGDETDLDCGGSCSAKCGEGQFCGTGADCASGFCNSGSHTCVDTQCHDNAKNGDESDVDCGGSCTANCENGQGCTAGSDCSSGFCNTSQQRCVATQCQDGAQNGLETDLDCGGACSSKCAIGQGCAAGSDCASSFCNLSLATCVGSQCEDGAMNGSETDLDCGGPCSTKCLNGMGCLAPTDCASSVCNLVMKECVSSPCFDGVTNGSETDVDCGGTCSVKCQNGQKCSLGADCVSTFCNASSYLCVATQCKDGLKNGSETDVDCGVSCSIKCALGKGCSTGNDCASSYCNASSHLCVASACEDGEKNGTETAVDCGGACAGKCPVDAGCLANSDCASGWCSNSTYKCVASHCDDAKKDDDETDTDCGGLKCAKCKNCASCSVGADCLSGTCTGAKMCGCGSALQECFGLLNLCLSTRVTIPNAGRIDATEVTYDQYKAWLAKTPAAPPPAPNGVCAWKSSYTNPSTTGNRPVNFVDWCDAWGFCNSVGKRLCGHVSGGPNPYNDYASANTDLWYRACSSNGANAFPYGGSYKPLECNTGNSATVDVGIKAGCTSTVTGYGGVFDLSGNVAEWEDSCSATTGINDYCRLRGGDYAGSSGQVECGANDFAYRNNTNARVGFRCCSQ